MALYKDSDLESREKYRNKKSYAKSYLNIINTEIPKIIDETDTFQTTQTLVYEKSCIESMGINEKWATNLVRNQGYPNARNDSQRKSTILETSYEESTYGKTTIVAES